MRCSDGRCNDKKKCGPCYYIVDYSDPLCDEYAFCELTPYCGYVEGGGEGEGEGEEGNMGGEGEGEDKVDVVVEGDGDEEVSGMRIYFFVLGIFAL